jgi:hypothetical protein
MVKLQDFSVEERAILEIQLGKIDTKNFGWEWILGSWDNISFKDLKYVLEGPKLSNEHEISPETQIRFIDCIWKPNKRIDYRNELIPRVEYPLRQAALDLFDLNIQTMRSSANFKNVFRHAYLILKELSSENYSYLEKNQFFDIKNSTIKSPLLADTTVGDVQEQMNQIISGLNSQPLLWGFWEASDLNNITGIVNNGGGVYCAQSHLLFHSLELYHKFHVSISETQILEGEKRVSRLRNYQDYVALSQYSVREARES